MSGPIAVQTWSNPQSLVAYIKAAQDNLLNIIPPSSFTQGHTTFPSRFGNTYYISDPDILRIVLKTRVDDFPKSRSSMVLIEPLAPDSMFIVHGNKWKNMHQTVIPVFNRRNVENFAPTIEDLAENLLQNIPTQDEIDVMPIMVELTFQIISNVIVGETGTHEFSQFRLMFDDFLNHSGRFSLFDLPAVLSDHFPNYRKLRYRNQIQNLRKTSETLIRNRLKSDSSEHQDFLEYLIQAYDLRNNPRRERRYEVEDNLLTFLIAGHETTSMMLSWGLYAIGFFPKAQEQIFEEATIPWNERKFTDAFLKEVLRLYPPAPLLSRTTMRDENFDGLTMQKREGVLIPILAIQRHHDYWERPDEFWPERFLETEPAPMTYMPFGAGPRVCIGQSFATMEAILIFSKILKKYKISPAGTEPKPQLVITLRSSNGLQVKIQKR